MLVILSAVTAARKVEKSTYALAVHLTLRAFAMLLQIASAASLLPGPSALYAKVNGPLYDACARHALAAVGL